MNFLDNFEYFFAPEIFFIGLLVFSLKGLENPQNWIFWKNLLFLKKCDFEDFQTLLEKKLKVLWKTFPGQEMLKIIQKIHFLYLEVGKTTSRWVFLAKIEKSKFCIFEIVLKIFFKNARASAWIKIYKIDSSKLI